jgi:heat shock protein HslJ
MLTMRYGRGDAAVIGIGGVPRLAGLACGLLGLLSACSVITPGPSGRPAPTLEGTQWQLEVLTSMSDEVPPARPPSPAAYTLNFQPGGRLLLRLDCNRGQSTWQAGAASSDSPGRRSGSLSFGPLATTRAACPPGSLEPRLLRELPAVRSFVLENGRLHLSLMADGGIQTWAPHAPTSP